MPTINEVLESARTYGFEYAILIVDDKGDVKVGIGLNGLSPKINDVINSYIELLNNFGVKYSKLVYHVKLNKEISILDIPMYFTLVDDGSNNFIPKPSGYM